MKETREMIDAFEALYKEEPKPEGKKKPSKSQAERIHFLDVCINLLLCA
jgi:hypothetical protein